MVYFDLGRTYKCGLDVVGLILRPEGDGRSPFSRGDIDGKPSVDGVSGDHLEAVNDLPVRGSTMGLVWSCWEERRGSEEAND
jgi:hypothetical protein